MTEHDDIEKARGILEVYDVAKHQVGPFNALINASELLATIFSGIRAEARREGMEEMRETAAQRCEWFARQNADIGTDYLTGRMHAGEALASHIRAIEAVSKEVSNA